MPSSTTAATVPGNKENNMAKKGVHEGLSIATASGGSTAFHTASSHHNRGDLGSAHHNPIAPLHSTGYGAPP